MTRNATKLANASKNLGRNACEKPRNDIAEVATVIMVTVIIEATTENATINTPDLHTRNPATMENLMANLTTMENHTANPKLAMVNPPMDIPRSFLG